MTPNSEIDNVDLKILKLLLDNANMPYTEIAKRVFVSGGTVHVRMRKMQDMGIVTGAQLKIDHTRLGFDITAFLGVYLEQSSVYDDVHRELAEVPEVVSMHYTTGIYSIFLKVICRDTKHLRNLLHDKIQRIPGIQRTETFISLEQSLKRSVNLDL